MHIVTEKAKHFCGNPELLAHRMTCRGVPGCSVALLQGGQVTHSAVSGAAGAAPVTEGTLFECASLTKPLFAVLALQLADERLLALDESVPARLGGEPWSVLIDQQSGDNFNLLGLSQFRVVINVDRTKHQRIPVLLRHTLQCWSQTAAIYTPGG